MILCLETLFNLSLLMSTFEIHTFGDFVFTLNLHEVLVITHRVSYLLDGTGMVSLQIWSYKSKLFQLCFDFFMIV